MSSIKQASVLVDGTVATTGGTATTFIDKGASDGTKLILDDSSEFIAATLIDFTIKDPKVNVGAPNGYTQGRSSVKVQVPLALDNTATTVNTLTIQLAVDPETTDAEIESMLVLGAQLLHDSDYSDFWKKQALS